MGTRSLTHVVGEGKRIINMYGGTDGYPSGHGKDLYDFLKDITMVNGIGEKKKNIANGPGCLAAQLVAHFKTAPGNFYLEPTAVKECGQEWEYIINVSFTPGPIHIKVRKGFEKKMKTVFDGSITLFGEWLKKQED
jgi:hypothetical protein